MEKNVGVIIASLFLCTIFLQEYPCGMKKFSLLLGALGGALAGYLMSNDKLRDELMHAKNPEAAAKTLGKHLQHDGKKIAHEAHAFVSSPVVQKNFKKVQKYAKTKFEEAKSEVKVMMKKGAKQAKSSAKSAKKAAGQAMKNWR